MRNIIDESTSLVHVHRLLRAINKIKTVKDKIKVNIKHQWIGGNNKPRT